MNNPARESMNRDIVNSGLWATGAPQHNLALFPETESGD